MRSRKLETAWRDFFQKPPTEQSLFEGAVLIAEFGQIDDNHSSMLLEVTTESSNKIVEKVIKLVGNSSAKSPSMTISFINKVLAEDMGFEAIGRLTHSEHSLKDFFIDKVNRYIFSISICIQRR